MNQINSEIFEKIECLKNNNISKYYSNLQNKISNNINLKDMFTKISSLDTIIAEKSSKNIDCNIDKEKKKELIEKLNLNKEYKEIILEEKRILQKWNELNQLLIYK